MLPDGRTVSESLTKKPIGEKDNSQKSNGETEGMPRTIALVSALAETPVG